MLFNLEQMSITNSPNKIYCSTGEWIIGKYKRHIQFADCFGNVKTQIAIPVDDDHYEVLETNDYFVLLFSGKDLITIAKNNGKFNYQMLDPVRIGRCNTHLYESKNQTIIFGTKSFNRSQIVRYDFLSQKRICQTSSWNLDSITDFYCQNDTAYAVLNNSMIVCADMNTGQTRFTRFEAGTISKNIRPYKNGIIYSTQGVPTLLLYPDVSRVPLTGRLASTLEQILDNKLYFTTDDSKELACFDMVAKKLDWSIASHSSIRQTLLIQTTTHKTAMVLRLDDYITFIDISNGSIIRNEKCEKSSYMRITGKNLIINKDTSTSIIEGAQDA